MQSINPATGEVIAVYPDHTPAEVDAALGVATGAFADWRRTSFAERSSRLNAVAGLLEARAQDWARLMTLETGKPIAEARAEIEKCAWVSRYYAVEAEGMLADRPIEAGRTRSYVHHEPLGPVLAVMPWNFPFWQVFRFAAPALMAGNVGVLSPAPTVSGCGLAIEEAFAAAGFPEGVFQTLLVPNDRVEEIVRHPGWWERPSPAPTGPGVPLPQSPDRSSRRRCSNSEGRTPTWSWPTQTSSWRRLPARPAG